MVHSARATGYIVSGLPTSSRATTRRRPLTPRTTTQVRLCKQLLDKRTGALLVLPHGDRCHQPPENEQGCRISLVHKLPVWKTEHVCQLSASYHSSSPRLPGGLRTWRRAHRRPLLTWLGLLCTREQCDLLLESLVHGTWEHIGKATYSCCLVSEWWGWRVNVSHGRFT